ncbi:capsule biosynthesis protein [[Haemophilus] felis]|uniref:Capsule biosynthesis protein n=1 Tax=[Haemophilus] felis TaxID=123822 RepID=A0A1T0AWN0_9PAST|nr:capsule biosynthesis protein [[Haemophilus] felis]OOS01861.1 capsule biosynthesis protein [[Haemophilus] felis]
MYNLASLSSSKNILLLQSPIGSFFYQLGKWLSKEGSCSVYKLNFNAGDRYFYPSNTPNTFDYTASKQEFCSFLANFVEKYQIQAIVCFGDTRPYHRIAKQFCLDNPNVQFWAFEEGYFRPDYITLGKDGVNDFSTLPRNADFFLAEAKKLPEPIPPKPLASGFLPMAKLATKYYLYANWHKKDYPNYEHHRRLDISYYVKLWLKSGLKRVYYYLRDRRFGKKVEQGKLDDFFIVPLQVYDDSQVKYHCDYPDVSAFLAEVLESFANFAPKNMNLIVKHHPMDRGFLDYGSVIEQYKKQYPNLAQRVYYIHDVPMPIFLRRAKGMVTLNSTSGISGLLHNIPVITLGRANYDFPGMTYQGDLNDFWCNTTPPNKEVFDAYRKFHLNVTHINGSYYNKVIWPDIKD